MERVAPRARGWTRRAWLGCLPLSTVVARAQTGQQFPSEKIRFADAATEFEVFRLTSPNSASVLPAYYGRAISGRGNVLLYASDRTGSMQGFAMDPKAGISRMLTQASDLDASSLTLLPGDRDFCYLDGGALWRGSLSGARGREVYSVEEGYRRGTGLGITVDGRQAFLVEAREGRSRLRMIVMGRGTATTILEADGDLRDPMPRPRRAAVLYRTGDGGLGLVHMDGANNRRLKLAPGGLGPAQWSPDGRSVLYLLVPGKGLNSLREFFPDYNEDRLIAVTSQFAHFGCNGNGSVFVGASGSRASPYILLLVRVARRELTLCEHRATDPAQVTPIFSPDSKTIYFQSDRDGRPSIYSMAVDRLVEPIET